ncbi:MAG: nuclear transport factor 2 family protein [Pyrinomonadaceae bacterium]
MKYCPSCLNQYTDLTLKFCLQDGTPLSVMPQKPPQKQSTIDTVAFSQPITETSFLPTTGFRVEQQNRTQHNVRPEAVKTAKRSNRALVALAVIVPVATLSVAGIGSGWYLLKDRLAAMLEQKETQQEDQMSAAPVPAASAVPETMKVNDPPVSTDAEAVRAEIANLVEQWKDLTEGHNAEELSQMYGEKVDYLGKSGTTTAEVRSSLQKIFDEYNEIDVNITNMSVAVDAEGTAATALFDNEWDYEANPKLASGKAHTKLHFQRADSDWKIVSERQLKIYYKEN